MWENLKKEDFEKLRAEELLELALKRFGKKVGFASSFGAEDVVIIDMLAKIDKEAYIFTLDTGRLPQETYNVIERIRDKYGVKIRFFFPDWKEVEKMENEYGPNLFYKSLENRKLCCRIRKILPLQRALTELDAWITGLRREQAVTRTDIGKVEIDEANKGIYKINPLADWSEEDVWNYIKENNVPYNKLHDLGYPSIGCAPCTRTVRRIEDIRAGRWWWEAPEYKECGLHERRA